jgi:hypothetical protein
MKNLILSLTCLFSFLAANAQSGFVDQLSADNSMLSMKPKDRTNVNIEGTPYIIEEFQPLTISGQKDKTFQGRYNGYNGDMEVLDVKKGVVFVLNKYMTNYDVNFMAQRKIYKSYKHKTEDGKVANGFFVRLSENNGVSLLKKENVKFFKEVKAVSTYDKARAAKYRRGNDQYFIKLNDADAFELSTKKKDIAKLFPEKSKDILKHIKSNKLNTKDEADLIKLVNYISTL